MHFVTFNFEHYQRVPKFACLQRLLLPNNAHYETHSNVSKAKENRTTYCSLSFPTSLNICMSRYYGRVNNQKTADLYLCIS